MATNRELLDRYIDNLNRAHNPQYPSHTNPDFMVTVDTSDLDTSVGDLKKSGYVRFSPKLPYYGAPKLRLHALEDASSFSRPLYDSMEKFTATRDGNQVEVDTSLFAKKKEDELIDDTFWDSWKNHETGRAYKGAIYPAVIDTIAHFSPHFTNMVDIFGGDGEFVTTMNKTEVSEQKTYHILDRNELSLKKAKETVAAPNVLVHPPVDLVTIDNIFDSVGSRPDVVTAIGGICKDIISRDDALRITHNVHEGLTQDGIFVVSGYSEVLLNAKDFEDIGFTVQNKAVPKNAVSLRPPSQMYVLRK